jgi:hypothetical protein
MEFIDKFSYKSFNTEFQENACSWCGADTLGRTDMAMLKGVSLFMRKAPKQRSDIEKS